MLWSFQYHQHGPFRSPCSPETEYPLPHRCAKFHVFSSWFEKIRFCWLLFFLSIFKIFRKSSGLLNKNTQSERKAWFRRHKVDSWTRRARKCPGLASRPGGPNPGRVPLLWSKTLSPALLTQPRSFHFEIRDFYFIQNYYSDIIMISISIIMIR